MKRLLLIGIGALIVAAFIFVPQIPKVQSTQTLKIDFNGHGMADANQQKIAYFKTKNDQQSPFEANVSWQIFTQPIPNQIYELDTAKIDASQYLQFQKELIRQLSESGKTIQLVTLQDLNTFPAGSFLLIPTGSIPDTFLKNHILHKLIEKNTTILYIGLTFDVTLEPDGAPVKNKSQWQNQSKTLGIEFVEATNAKAKNHTFLKNQYAVRLNTQNNATRIYINDDTVFSISYENHGTLAIIPNTLDNGWQKGTNAAQDIAQIIENGQWQPVLAEQKKPITFQPGPNTLISPAFNGKEAFAQVKIETTNATQRFSAFVEEMSGRQINAENAAPGEKIPISVTLQEKYSETKQLNLILLVDKNENVSQQNPMGGATVKNLGFASTAITAPNEPGDYLLELKDQDNQIHAESLLHVTNMTVRFIREDYTDGAFSVQILKDNQPQANTPYRISLDGANNKTLTTDDAGIASFNTKASLQPLHTLTFYGPNTVFEIRRPHIDADFINSPFAYGIILFILAIFGAGFLFAVKSKNKYYVDIPDFPEENVHNRSIDAEDVVRAFEKANNRFSGKYAPMTLPEIKDALKETLELPIRTSLTDANIKTILIELEKRGKIKSSHDYFLLTNWEKQVHKSVEFLALKRMAIDELVKNGQPYQENSWNELKTNSVTLHLFEEKNLTKIETSLKRNKSLIVFPNREDLDDFINRLKTKTDALSIRLYLELNHGTYRAICVDQIGEATKP